MKKLVLALICAVAALGLMSVPVYAANACDYCPEGDSNCELVCKKQSESDAENMVGKIIQTVFMIVGIIAVIVIIIGGIMYATSQGDSGKLTTAKNTILYAAIGLIISLLSFAIVSFVLTTMGGSSEAKTDDNKTLQTGEGDNK